MYPVFFSNLAASKPAIINFSNQFMKSKNLTAARPVAAKRLTTAPKAVTKTIARNGVWPLIQKNGAGKIFSVTVDTENTKARVLTGRLTGPTKTGKSTGKPSDNGMLRMYDLVDKGWKTVNLQTVSEVRCGGISYRVRK